MNGKAIDSADIREKLPENDTTFHQIHSLSTHCNHKNIVRQQTIPTPVLHHNDKISDSGHKWKATYSRTS